LPQANFSGHYFVARRQKAWFLPAALADGACGALAAISADVGLDSWLAAAQARQCQSLVRVLVYQASV
jgi:hypothetical protein